MDIYTYCSYRGSRKGFQFCHFSSIQKDKVQSLLSSELSGKSDIINEEFKNWCENESEWNLVFKKTENKNRFLLMVHQLEKSKINRGPADCHENSTESDFYMSLCFSGSLNEIEKYFRYFLKSYKNDGFRSIYNRLENTLSKSDDLLRYIIDTKEFNQIIINEVQRESFETSEIDDKDIIIKILSRIKNSSDSYYSANRIKKYQESIKKRKSNIDDLVQKKINFHELSDDIILLIAYSSFETSKKTHIRIDYEYVWGY